MYLRRFCFIAAAMILFTSSLEAQDFRTLGVIGNQNDEVAAGIIAGGLVGGVTGRVVGNRLDSNYNQAYRQGFSQGYRQPQVRYAPPQQQFYRPAPRYVPQQQFYRQPQQFRQPSFRGW